MNEMLEKYFKNAKKRELFKRGLYEVKYYSFEEVSELNKNNLGFDQSKNQYYELIPLELTDEEYQEILKYNYIAKNDKYYIVEDYMHMSLKDKQLILPEVFNVLGYIVLVLGIVGSLYLGEYLLFGIINSFVSAVILFGFGKIIELLSEIKNK